MHHTTSNPFDKQAITEKQFNLVHASQAITKPNETSQQINSTGLCTDTQAFNRSSETISRTVQSRCMPTVSIQPQHRSKEKEKERDGTKPRCDAKERGRRGAQPINCPSSRYCLLAFGQPPILTAILFHCQSTDRERERKRGTMICGEREERERERVELRKPEERREE